MNKSRLVAVCLGIFIAIWSIHFAVSNIQKFGPIKGHTVAATQGPSSLVRSLRPIYPYSVISGGAYSPGELQFAHSKDAVVQAHYADFNIRQAKMVTLTDERYQYVSYRVRNQVYWTKKKLRIPKGELLLTDGTNYARARCGNRLSDKPHKALTSLHEPDPALLSLPPVNPGMLPKLALANPPALGDIPGTSPLPVETRTGAPTADVFSTTTPPFVPFQPIWGGQPIIGGPIPGAPLVPAGGSPITSTITPTSPNTPTTQVIPPSEPPPISPVPEPDSIYLFLISLSVSIWALLRISPKDEPEDSSKR